MAAAGDEQIRRLDVAVDNAGRVRGVERVGDLDGDRQQFVECELPLREALLQRGPLQDLHDEEWAAVLVADVVNGADAGVVQRGGGPRLALEPGQRLAIIRQIGRKKFERDEAPQARVLGLVDDAHPAAAEPLDNAVVGERLTDERIVAQVLHASLERPSA